jgi:EAL domain-containing protein (putative c-di-GMP-specific phosphodiesterase class I)
VEGVEVVVSCSGGIATFPDDGRDVDTLFRHAEAALHEAKARGRDGFQRFDGELQSKLERRHEIERRLRAALASGEPLELHYQPQVEVPSGRVAGVEALLRWRTDASGPISPTELVSVAEETGLIQPLGDWVLRTACLQAKAWSERGSRAIRVAVNVSARQFGAHDFAEKVAAVLAETQLDASLLELEITEGLLMFDTSNTCRVLTQLKLLGVRIALDDFGTGYSSLAYLTRFPIDCLKIDRSFIMELGVTEKSEAIVAAIIALARSLSIDVVAEGVETVEQRDFLERFGSLEIQGWLFSKALPHDLAKAWIERRERALDEVSAPRHARSAFS